MLNNEQALVLVGAIALANFVIFVVSGFVMGFLKVGWEGEGDLAAKVLRFSVTTSLLTFVLFASIFVFSGGLRALGL